MWWWNAKDFPSPITADSLSDTPTGGEHPTGSTSQVVHERVLAYLKRKKSEKANEKAIEQAKALASLPPETRRDLAAQRISDEHSE